MLLRGNAAGVSTWWLNTLLLALLVGNVRCFQSASPAQNLQNVVQREVHTCPLRSRAWSTWQEAPPRSRPGAAMMSAHRREDRRDALHRLTLLTVGSAGVIFAPCPAPAAAPASKQADSEDASFIMTRLDGTPGSLQSMPEALPIGTRQVFYPEWMLGDWTVRSRLFRASYPQGSPPPGRLGDGTLRSNQERVGSEVRLNARYMIDRGSVGGIRASTKKRIVEDRAMSERSEAEVLRGEAVSQALYSTRSDPTRVTLLLDDGAKIPSRRELVVTNRASASSERGDFLSSESFRSIDVSEGVASVAEYEIITMISPPDGGVVKGRRRVAVYVAPAPVQDRIAKMRSVGSLIMWAALTKGTVPEGSVGVDIKSSGRTPVAVFDYELELSPSSAEANSELGYKETIHRRVQGMQLGSSWLAGVDCAAV